MQWIASSKLHIIIISHVLDDFLLLARDKAAGQAQLSSFLSMCADIGIPIAPDKTVQPTQVITFLCLELDSVAMPVDKLNKCTALIETCLKKDKIQLKPLQSFTGTLNFACQADSQVVPGRPFFKKIDQFDDRGDTSLSLHSHHTRGQGRSEDLVNIPTGV